MTTLSWQELRQMAKNHATARQDDTLVTPLIDFGADICRIHSARQARIAVAPLDAKMSRLEALKVMKEGIVRTINQACADACRIDEEIRKEEKEGMNEPS